MYCMYKAFTHYLQGFILQAHLSVEHLCTRQRTSVLIFVQSIQSKSKSVDNGQCLLTMITNKNHTTDCIQYSTNRLGIASKINWLQFKQILKGNQINKKLSRLCIFSHIRKQDTRVGARNDFKLLVRLGQMIGWAEKSAYNCFLNSFFPFKQQELFQKGKVLTF